MKKVFVLVCLIALIIALFSCDDDSDGPDISDTIRVELSVNELYIYDMGFSGDEEGGLVKTQASHFAISEVTRDEQGAQIIYRYQPMDGYTGEDSSVIEIQTGSDGGSPPTESIFIRFEFTIIES